MLYVKLLRKFVEAILSRDFDLETFVIKAVEESLDLDPTGEVWARLKVVKYMLKMWYRRALGRGDLARASEKLYKVVERVYRYTGMS